MCFVLGILSLIQVIFLPGCLLLQVFNLRLKFLRFIIFSFGLSLIINYSIVFLAVIFGFYNQVVIYTIFGLESFFVVYLNFNSIIRFLKKPFLPQTENLEQVIFKFKNLFLQNYKNTILSRYIFIIFLGVVFCLIWGLFIFLNNIQSFSIFLHIDDACSWNPWAVDWFKGIFPSTFRYPQLIPINFSITYIFMKAALQFFPKIIMPLFFLNILFLIFDLGITKRSLGYFFGIITTTLVFINGVGGFITRGYADIPVAFMSFLSISCLLMAQEVVDIQSVKKYLLLGAIIACGAAITKQSGLLIVLFYPFFSFFLVIKNKIKNFSIKQKLYWLLIYFVMIILIV